MKHFDRSLLNPTPASIPSTFAKTFPGEPASNAAPFSSKRVDRDSDGMVAQGEFGEFCVLGGNEPPPRKARANEGRS